MSEVPTVETLNQIEELPTLPVVAQQVLRLISMPNSNMNQIAAVASRDQAISAKVVRLVNSAFYGLRNRASSLQHAIVILGLNTVKNLVIGVSVVKTFGGNDSSSIFDRDKFWLHVFSTAMGAKLIAQRRKEKEAEDFFLAGLLHDIGILVVDQFLHDDFVQILDTSLKDGSDYLTVEREVLGISHGEVGAYLGKRWKLPEFLLAAMARHHDPHLICNGDHKKIQCVVAAADVLSSESGVGRFIPRFRTQPSIDPEAATGLRRIDLDEISERVEQETNALMKEWMQ